MNKPIGIIKTMPQSWLKKLPKGIEGWEKEFLSMNEIEDKYWIFNLSGKPKHEVLYFYLNYDRAIRFRANILGYGNYGTIKCYTGETKSGKIWVQVSQSAKTLMAKSFIRKGSHGGYLPNLKSRLESDLEVHGATNEEIENLYNHIFDSLLKERIKEIL